MDNKFQAQKDHVMNALDEARKKGEVDEDMIPLAECINSFRDYYTTSTCTGRISLFHDPGSKLGSGWVGKWHREVLYEEVSRVMEKIPEKGMIWFMQEPTIMHVVCRDLPSAVKLINLARDTGYKKVGILSVKDHRVIVEICSTERIDAPIAQDRKVLVSQEYLEYLTQVANKKFRKGFARLKRLESALGSGLKNSGDNILRQKKKKWMRNGSVTRYGS